MLNTSVARVLAAAVLAVPTGNLFACPLHSALTLSNPVPDSYSPPQQSPAGGSDFLFTGPSASLDPKTWGPTLNAVLVPPALNRLGYRTAMFNEGLLEMQQNPFAANGLRFGHEYTGWVDVRHPALAGPRSTLLGYDRYERQFDQATTILTDRNGVVAAADVTRDLNHANRVFATQSGTSIIERSTRGYTSPAAGNPGSFDFPLSHGLGAGQIGQPQEEQAIMGQNVGAPRVNVYYARDLTSGAYGETYNPSFTAGLNNEAVFMAERVRTGPNTFIPITRNTQAHEFTHYVTDGLGLHQQNANPDQAHSGDLRNIIGNPQWDPGQNVVALGGVIPDNDIVAGPSVSTSNAQGMPKVGGISQLKKPQVFTAAAGANPAQGAYGSAAVNPYLTKNENRFAGDRVDWNFAVDDWITEDLGGGADNWVGGRESLYFTTGNPVNPGDPVATADNGGKDKTGLGVFNNPAYHQGTFRYADIFSINARYGDYDVDDQGNESFRADNLDYDVTFVLPGNVLVPGVPTDVFTDGWSNTSFADDYLARWQSPADAIGVLVTAHRYLDAVTGESIGNCQIDAVIVANFIPEPASIGAVLLGMTMLARRRR